MNTNQYLTMFIDESKEHLQAMNDNMLALEHAPGDIEIVQRMFRSAHTLKGMSATMGFEDIASLTHEMENVLDMARNGKLRLEGLPIDCIFQSLDALDAMVADIVGGGSDKADVAPIIADLKAIESGTYQAAGSARTRPAAGHADPDAVHESAGMLDQYQSTIVLHSFDSGHSVHRIDVAIRRDCLLKSVRAYMVFDSLNQLGEVVKSEPSVDKIEADAFDYAFTVVLVSRSTEEQLKSVVMNISEIESVTVTPITEEQLASVKRAGAAAAGTPAKLAADGGAAAVAGTPFAAFAAVSAGSAPAVAVASPAAPAPKSTAKPGTASAPTRTIRVDIEKLDTLMNLFSEMLIDRVRLEQLAGEVKRADLIETVEHMGRVSSDLQNVVMKLRMMPVESVFNRFPRMVRDIARSLNKKVELIISGADTELDRTVIDEIGDPLVHLLRNSVDHGVESVGERLAAGKPETGIVHLRAFHSGNHVFIEVEEDGKGINRSVVLAKAIKSGVVAKDAGEAMSDEEVYQLLFAPGFSTAEIVSDISGRGVGLDVVKSKITSLGGHVHVSSTPGRGTKFSIQLPLTLSIIMAMMIKLGSEKYAVPLSSIVETLIVRREAVRRVHGNRMIDYRSKVVPLLSLSKLLEVKDFSEESEEESEVMIVRKGDRLAAVSVDELIGQQEIVIKPLGAYLTNVFAISGATILGDGQVALIVDTNALIK